MKPIIMSAFSVRAILDRRKFQTRRVIKPQPIHRPSQAPGGTIIWTKSQAKLEHLASIDSDQFVPEMVRTVPHVMWAGDFKPYGLKSFCPYGQAGDHLWVRETHWRHYRRTGVGWHEGSDGEEWDECLGDVRYCATDEEPVDMDPYHWWEKKPSIFMPKWASRITLRLLDVQTERLQDISQLDAKQEGVKPTNTNGCWGLSSWWYDYRDGFRRLWDELNAKRGYPWESNPWVWKLVFEVEVD